MGGFGFYGCVGMVSWAMRVEWVGIGWGEWVWLGLEEVGWDGFGWSGMGLDGVG